MKVRVDPDKCQGHARCYGLAPEIFDVDDYGQASVIVDTVPPELEEKARLAVANCPEYAIDIITESTFTPSRELLKATTMGVMEPSAIRRPTMKAFKPR